ncbi:MAG TPA: class I SAM-dependent methyltransferase [Acidimicrobiia bacterium]|nr:class I SAM-dependent methyltransferase [Acidimicrobiia bacterium]
MSEYDIGVYGAIWAPFYDELFDASESEVRFLKPFAGDPPRALELAIGSGRVALPLSAAGVEMTGIDISADMIGLLRAKPGGDGIQIIEGDFADVAVEDTYPLVYLPFNTLFALLDQDRQIDCFVNTARALEPGGRFVLDAFVPDMTRFDRYQTRMAVESITSDQAHAYELSIHDPVAQRVVSHHVRRQEDGSTVVLPVTIRYAWPAEIDLMAKVAGLELEDRFGWYDRRRFTEQSSQHVSVYRKPG